jgi:hypothetical protein
LPIAARRRHDLCDGEASRAGARDQELAQVAIAILVIRPSRVLPPVEFWRGVRSRKAANSRPLANSPASWIVATLPCGDRADARYGHQPLGRLVRLDRHRKVAFDRSDRLVERVYLTDKQTKRAAHAIGDHDLAILVETTSEVSSVLSYRRERGSAGRCLQGMAIP